MRIVDFHLHFFSRPFFETLARQTPQAGSVKKKLARLAQEAGIEIPDGDNEAHTRRWVAELDAHGVGHAVAFASLPEEVPAVHDALRTADGRLSGCALVNPLTPQCAEDVWTLIKERGFSGVLLFPALHHFHLGAQRVQRMLTVLDDRAAIAFVHCGLLVVKMRDRLGLPRPYDLKYADPLGVIPAANRFPRAKFVLPHFGGGFFREALMAGSQCENVYVDTSSSNRWIATQPGIRNLFEVCARTLDVYGPERILFGTDSSVFPPGWRRDRLEEQLAAFEKAGARGAQLQLIFAGNAERLLGLAQGTA
ncbi:MAG: amidohydrolase family protein [Planctomycetota bacterium]|jgi:predicted TIM-barrel fold metal-dependent hydrolase